MKSLGTLFSMAGPAWASSTSPCRPAWWALGALCWLALLPLSTLPCAAADDFSPSEQTLFMANHLERLKPPTQLNYSYKRSGSLEAAFEDTVQVKLNKRADGACCQASADFLTGERRLVLPDVEAASANPVILYFLERDIREMSRLTKGQAAYFRKRIRLAIYKGAKLTDVVVNFKGQAVPAQRISIQPYVDDALRSRFEQLADKTYIFTLSKQVPGAVVSIRAIVKNPAGNTTASAQDAPYWLEELLAEGATSSPP
jgi:hypothetical protein